MASVSAEGCLVQTSGLSVAELNEKQGVVVGMQKGQGAGRVVVELDDIGRKALKAENLSPEPGYCRVVCTLNACALLLSIGYLAAALPSPPLSALFFRAALCFHAAHYAYLIRNLRVFRLSMQGVNAVAATASGQLLCWIMAFLFLGETCYFLVGALACYAVIAMARTGNEALSGYLIYFPGAYLMRSRLNDLRKALDARRIDMAAYDARDWTGVAKPPSPPAHYLEIAGVCLELFAGVQQLFQIVIAATSSMAMLVICWRYLGYRYSLPQNRVVRAVFSMSPHNIPPPPAHTHHTDKAREMFDGYAHKLPGPVYNGYHWATEKLWGTPVPP